LVLASVFHGSIVVSLTYTIYRYSTKSKVKSQNQKVVAYWVCGSFNLQTTLR
jgi:hypothetical protein